MISNGTHCKTHIASNSGLKRLFIAIVLERRIAIALDSQTLSVSFVSDSTQGRTHLKSNMQKLSRRQQ